MTTGLLTASYITASVLFILALGGLSNQEKAKRAVWYGIVGMIIAVIATIFGNSVFVTEWLNWLIISIVVGSIIGAFVAKKVQMMRMPQLVASTSLICRASCSFYQNLTQLYYHTLKCLLHNL